MGQTASASPTHSSEATQVLALLVSHSWAHTGSTTPCENLSSYNIALKHIIVITYMIIACKEGTVTGLVLSVIMSFSPTVTSLGEENIPFSKSLVLTVTSKIKPLNKHCPDLLSLVPDTP